MMKELLKKLDLIKIDEHIYEGTLSGGQASTSLIYSNITNQEKIVVKLLIAPRNHLELSRFKEEVETLIEIENFQKSIYNNNSVPTIKIPLTKHKSLPIYYFAMEFIVGICLDDYIKLNPLPWKWETATEFIMALSMSIQSFIVRHVHRDLHPKNIMVVEDLHLRNSQKFSLKILDFGCSRNRFKSLYHDIPDDEFRLPGAISSWSPELIKDPTNVDHKHDIWAIGVLFHRLLTGEYPFEIKSLGDVISVFAKETLDFNKIENLNCPMAIKLLMKNILQINSSKRFGIAEIYEACNAILKTKLLEMSDETIIKYFNFRASLVECLICRELISIRPNRCSKCGTLIVEENILVHF